MLTEDVNARFGSVAEIIDVIRQMKDAARLGS
jgi:hypothetical protein